MEQKGNCTQQWTGSELLLQYEFETKQTTEIPIVAKDGITNGHGGDDGIILLSL